jgi:hypothetical protein
MPASNVINVRLTDLRQFFNSLDPSPFHEKDLDRDAEDYIVGWAEELPEVASWELVIQVPEDQLDLAQKSDVAGAVHNYFACRAKENTRKFASS